MPKIHVVQIALTTCQDTVYSEYLDNAGRVWVDTGMSIKDEEKSKISDTNPYGSDVYKWIPNWQQLELPDAPAS